MEFLVLFFLKKKTAEKHKFMIKLHIEHYLIKKL